MPPSQDPRHPYHIPPTYFGSSDVNPDSQAGPSISRRRSSLQPPAIEARGSLTDSDKFRDAEDENGDQDYDLGRDLLAFNPPPARTGPNSGLSAGSILSSPYQPHAPRPPDQPYTPSSAMSSHHIGYGESPSSSAAAPGRDRLPSSNSISSMSSATGRRAPAPAPLNLSPRREVRNPYDGLGHGVPSTETRRIATDPFPGRVSFPTPTLLTDQRSVYDPRPLPLPPGAGASTSTTHRTYSREPSYNSNRTGPATPLDPPTTASVPLSAVGDRHTIEGSPSRSYRNLQPGHVAAVPS
jgi:hypothetical protein